MRANGNRDETTRANGNRGETTQGANGIRGETTRYQNDVVKLFYDYLTSKVKKYNIISAKYGVQCFPLYV